MNKMLETVLQNAIKQNPNYMNLLDELNRSGLSAEEFFYKKANEMGVNPEQILSQLR